MIKTVELYELKPVQSNSIRSFIDNSDGTQSKQISQENGEYFNPTWSPLGDMIAFSKSEGGNSYIGVMDIDGSNERMITTGYLFENKYEYSVVRHSRCKHHQNIHRLIQNISLRWRNIERAFRTQ